MTTPKRPRGRMTAAEHEAWLKETGQYAAMVERQRKQEEGRLNREAEYRIAEAPLVDELRAAGLDVKSAWDLVNTSVPYPKAIPILLAHLERPYPVPVREGIARALAVPGAICGWNALLRAFRSEQEKRVLDGLACALAAAANDAVIDDVVALVEDQTVVSRGFLVEALGRSRKKEALAALRRLCDDAELGREAKRVLRGAARTR